MKKKLQVQCLGREGKKKREDEGECQFESSKDEVKRP